MAKVKTEKKIGLDIGSYAVKMVEIDFSKDGNRLASFEHKKIETTSQEALIELVKGICSESKVKTREANLAVSGPQVITRFINMPNMSDADMKNALAFEVEKYIPFSAEEVTWDYQVIERGKEKKADVLLTAVKRDYVQKYIQIAESCDLDLQVIDVDSFALANAFLKNFEGAVDPEKTVALINIGDRYTNLDILNVDAKLAEKLKHQPEDRAADVSMPIRMVLANIIDELRLSFGYFENRFGRGVDDVYLSGGSCNLIGLKEFFEESLGSKTAVWDPLKAFIVDDATMQAALTNDVRCSLAVSVGLAIR